MSTITPEDGQPSSASGSLFRNWISLAGGILSGASLFAFAFLVAIDSFSHHGNPYLGILTYVVAPIFLITGLVLVFGGWWWQRRQLRRNPATAALPRSLSIDLSRPRDRKVLLLFGTGSLAFLLLTAFGSYQTYHFTESVEFCGKTCHKVMEPEFSTYHRSAHARVACAECHIGSGASWFVKSKISGSYQVYSVLFDKYSTPIPTPVHNLRPAQDTCERCHWPQKFTGNIDRTYEHFLSNKANTETSVRLLLHVGGGKAAQGHFAGIHWHMNPDTKVEYFSDDPKRQVIPWVRVTNADGSTRIFRTEEFTGDPAPEMIRRMDCIDCHNRPAHVHQTANAGIEEQMAAGHLPLTLPNIKRVAVDALSKPYANTEEATKGIAAALAAKYPKADGLEKAIASVQDVYSRNFFPFMKSDWRAYPNNLGHKDWPGCFRCHDDKHVATVSGRTEKVRGSDCNSCHTLLAQGRGEELLKLAPSGLAFKHPGGDYDPELKCNDCHNGGNQ